MTTDLHREISDFLKAKESMALEARQMAALQIACHFDLADALAAPPVERARIAARLQRMIERERQRGARKHWSYDLNRHIALKQALDRLVPARSAEQEIPRPRTNATRRSAGMKNGALRRRSRTDRSALQRGEAPAGLP